MPSSILRAALALGAVAALAASSGCGSNADRAQPSTQQARAGGTLTATLSAKPDYLDPALTYTTDGWMVMWNAYTPLLTYRRVEGLEGTQLIPGLARDLPTVSADGRTYRLRLRSGLRYSDGSPVRASDFEHAVQRLLSLESGATGYFEPIVGVDRYLQAGKPSADIAGIAADDATGDITIRLSRRVGSFANVLAMTFAAPVAASTPFENRSAQPPAGVGALRLTDSSSTGVTLERNPYFRGLPGVPVAKPDRITVRYVNSQQRQALDVLRNRVDLMYDPPPPDTMAEVRRDASDRFATFPTSSTYYIFLNRREAPFDDERVRQAVNFAVDKRALVRLFGGLLKPSCNFLPSRVPGYRELDPCPYGDPTAAPDLDRARALIREAGAEGAKVTVWGNDAEPSRSVTQYVAEAMRGAGLDAEPKIIDGAVYFPTMGNRATHAQAGFANWSQDFPHPSNFLFLLDGRSIQPTNSVNFGNVDDPQINALLHAADPQADLDRVIDDYAEADALAVRRAYLIPYGEREMTKFVSDRVAFDTVIAHPVYGIDLSQVALERAP